MAYKLVDLELKGWSTTLLVHSGFSILQMPMTTLAMNGRSSHCSGYHFGTPHYKDHRILGPESGSP